MGYIKDNKNEKITVIYIFWTWPLLPVARVLAIQNVS